MEGSLSEKLFTRLLPLFEGNLRARIAVVAKDSAEHQAQLRRLISALS